METSKGNNQDMENAKKHLQRFIDEKETDELRELNDVKIDTRKPVLERMISFIEQIGDPYYFKVGGTPVRVTFQKNANTFQECMEKLVSNSH